ncbi:MAG TPA: methyltransferase domain-containing protein [Chloroflexota bacterium]|nr:methyltransferase domain-containing protein [Chloroflexota bacterium]
MPIGAARGMSEEAAHRHPVPAADRPSARASVFDDYQWWNERDVLTQVTPARLAYLRRVAGALEGARVLDLGCGGGMLAEPLARAGARLTGIDVSFNALAAARDHARQSALGIGYLRSLGEELPFRDGAFDLVVAFDVLEHLEDLPMAMEEIGRVLRPGGRFVYDTMNRTLLCRVPVVWGATGAAVLTLAFLLPAWGLGIALGIVAGLGPLYTGSAALIGLLLLGVPGWRLLRHPTPPVSLALFNRASFYPPAMLAALTASLLLPG